eukprot:8786902-Pyramimonas_sp.AAC.1
MAAPSPASSPGRPKRPKQPCRKRRGTSLLTLEREVNHGPVDDQRVPFAVNDALVEPERWEHRISPVV